MISMRHWLLLSLLIVFIGQLPLWADEVVTTGVRPEYWQQAYWNEHTEQWQTLRWYTVGETSSGIKMNAVEYSVNSEGVLRPTSIQDVNRTDVTWQFTLSFSGRLANFDLSKKAPELYEGLCQTVDQKLNPVEFKSQLTRIPNERIYEAHQQLLLEIDSELQAVEIEDATLQQYIEEGERKIRIDERLGREVSIIRRVTLMNQKSRRTVLAIRKQTLQRNRVLAQRTADKLTRNP